MAFRPADFRDDTDFERLVLARLGTHGIAFAGPGAVYHLGDSPRGGNISVSVGAFDSLGGSAREDLRRSLQPLSFGAAYKTLDLLVEHVLRATGAGVGRLTFARKRSLVTSRPAVLPVPFNAQPAMWDRLAALYDRFEQPRHAITHRRAQGTPDGGLDIYDDAGSQIDQVTGAEVAAFTGAVHVSAELVIASSDDSRRVALVAWYLNEMQARHGLGMVADALDPAAGTRLAKLDLSSVGEGTWRLNVGRLREVIEGQPSPSVWDLELSAGARLFTTRWEDVPDQSVDSLEFEANAPPSWIKLAT
jgi:hypothetical protein